MNLILFAELSDGGKAIIVIWVLLLIVGMFVGPYLLIEWVTRPQKTTDTAAQQKEALRADMERKMNNPASMLGPNVFVQLKIVEKTMHVLPYSKGDYE